MKTLRLALEWFLNPDHVPFLVAQERGWLRAAGLALELVEPKEHFDAFAAMQRGEIDVAITEPIHLVQDAARGEGLVGFARFLHTQGGVMVLARSGVTRPRELAGKRVQYPGAPGPGGLAIVETMIRADGGEPGALTPVNRGFQHTNALAEDAADAATLVFFNFEVVEARARGLAPRLFALEDWGVPDFCQLILVARPETLAERRAELAALVKALRRGIDATKQEPAACRELYLRRAEAAPDDALTNAIFDATVPCFTRDLSMCRAYYERLGAWLVATGQSAAAPSFDAIWTNELAL